MTSGMAIYDTVSFFLPPPATRIQLNLPLGPQMQFVSSPVHTICIGQASSMASLLLAGGKIPRSPPSNH